MIGDSSETSKKKELIDYLSQSDDHNDLNQAYQDIEIEDKRNLAKNSNKKTA